MNYEELVNRDNDEPLTLKPEIDNKDTTSDSYTKIVLKNLTRKTIIPVESTAFSILTRLNIFDKDFICIIKDDTTNVEMTKKIKNTNW